MFMFYNFIFFLPTANCPLATFSSYALRLMPYAFRLTALMI